MHGHLRQGRTYRSKMTLRRRKLDLFAQINWQVDRMGIVGPAATLSLARNHEWPVGRGSRCDCGLDDSNTVLLTRLVASVPCFLSTTFYPGHSTASSKSPDCLFSAESLFYQIANNKPRTFSPISVH